ncbi:MAG: hypothetical protein ACI865_003419 [Flavobacteriaceae bacterium]
MLGVLNLNFLKFESIKLFIMKSLLTVLILFTLSTGYSQTDCKPYVPATVGSTWELTNYSKKDKATGRTAYELLELMEGTEKMTFKIKVTSFDDKDEEVYVNTCEAYCVNGVFDFGMEFMMDGSTMSAYEEMDVEVDASKFEIPTLTEPTGTELADGELIVAIGKDGMNMFTMKVYVTDRLIEAREEQQTEAGTFDCIVLSQKVSTRLLFKIESSSKEWYAEEVGLVRSESYDKKGKLTGYSVLTKIDRK